MQLSVRVGAFEVSVTTKILAVFQKPEKEAVPEDTVQFTQQNAAAGLPLSMWRKLSHASLVWTVKWATQGLMPVRPVIAVTVDGSLPQGKTLWLTPDGEPKAAQPVADSAAAAVTPAAT